MTIIVLHYMKTCTYVYTLTL